MTSRIYAKQQRAHEALERDGRDKPAGHADDGQHQPSRTNIRLRAVRSRAKRGANPDLPRPLRHRVGEDAVDAHDAEQERHAGRDGEHDEREGRAVPAIGRRGPQRTDLRQRQIAFTALTAVSSSSRNSSLAGARAANHEGVDRAGP